MANHDFKILASGPRSVLGSGKGNGGEGWRRGIYTITDKSENIVLSKCIKQQETPGWIGATSGGFLPHISGDTLERYVKVNSVYISMEDFIVRGSSGAVVYNALSEGDDLAEMSIGNFVGLDDGIITIVGGRRVDAECTGKFNGDQGLAIRTRGGAEFINGRCYGQTGLIMRGDILVGIGDINVQTNKITDGKRRSIKRVKRTINWTREALELINGVESPMAYFAPAFTTADSLQVELDKFTVEMAKQGLINGIGIYDETSLSRLAQLKPLTGLPRLCMAPSIRSPHNVLACIEQGGDLFVVSFVNAASEAGHAFTFRFGKTVTLPRCNQPHSWPLKAYINVWDSETACLAKPLEAQCTCYTCKRHYIAYIHHLLSTREMSAMILLQIHNYAMINEFFTAVRKSLDCGSWAQDYVQFMLLWEQHLW